MPVERMTHVLRRVRAVMWRRHRHPASGLTRMALGPMLGVAVWWHAWPLILLLLVAIATNPFWFPPPERDRHWMTRAVDGERLWLERADWLERLLVTGVPGLMVIPLLAVLWTHQVFWTAFFAIAVLGHKVLFVIWALRIADAVPLDVRRPR